MPKVNKKGKVTVSAKEQKEMAEDTIQKIDRYEIEEETKKILEKDMKKQGFVLNQQWEYDDETDTHIGTFMNKYFEVVSLSFGAVEIEENSEEKSEKGNVS